MAYAAPHDVQDLTCPVCFNIYKDPVLLSCSHTFCKACLQKYWNGGNDTICPICRRRSSKSNPPCNLALKNLCEAWEKTQAQATPGAEEVCSLHSAKLKVFCLDDRQAICAICQSSKRHKTHNFCPLDEAVEDHKEKLQAALKPLQNKLKVFNQSKQQCDETAAHMKDQANYVERMIKKQFEELHHFLQEEEEARIAALREEEEQKTKAIKGKIEGLSREILTLSATIRTIEEEMRAGGVSFLQNYEATVKRTQCIPPDPPLVSGALVDVAKHLGNLTFRVWEKMKERVKFTPVILDPNTAASWLSLSDDLTSGRWISRREQLPDNPERNAVHPMVLGSEGFSSGEHSWEVEVGDHPLWTIGVAKESVHRKKKLCSSPENGVWSISLMDGEYIRGQGQTFTLKRRLQRIRVQLDYDRGQVSFYDPEQMTVICTHKYSFTEKLYPFFSIANAKDAKHPNINICQSDVSISVTQQP